MDVFLISDKVYYRWILWTAEIDEMKNIPASLTELTSCICDYKAATEAQML